MDSSVAPKSNALPGEVAKNGGFRMAICLDEFQQIHAFNGKTVENALRNAAQVNAKWDTCSRAHNLLIWP